MEDNVNPKKAGHVVINLSAETAEEIKKQMRVNESWDDLLSRLFLGEDVKTGRAFRVFVVWDVYEKMRAECAGTKVPMGKLMSRIVSEHFESEEKEWEGEKNKW